MTLVDLLGMLLALLALPSSSVHWTPAPITFFVVGLILHT